MYVSRNKRKAVVFACCLNSDHWSNLVPRLMLQGLNPDTVYEVSEPLPNNMTQRMDNFMVIESDQPVYQLGVSSVPMTGNILMKAGLPLKFYTLDDSVMFYLEAAGSFSTFSKNYTGITKPRKSNIVKSAGRTPDSTLKSISRTSSRDTLEMKKVVVGVVTNVEAGLSNFEF